MADLKGWRRTFKEVSAAQYFISQNGKFTIGASLPKIPDPSNKPDRITLVKSYDRLGFKNSLLY